MKKKWLIALYKINELKRVQNNLLNQEFNYYLPKITIKKINLNSKEELLFPGYIFVNTNVKNYSALKYTIGIKNVLKFGNNIPCLSDNDIKSMQIAEERSRICPVKSQIEIGQNAFISNGSFKGVMVKIYSLPSNNRVGIFLNFLGSQRRVTISQKSLTF